jgi:hypothetical protein
MRSRPLICAVLLAAVPAMCSAATLAIARATDGFEYDSLPSLHARWTITNSGFSTSPEIGLTAKDVKEGKKALRLVSAPTAGKENARIDLDIKPNMPLHQVKQIRFWLYIDDPQFLASTGLHFGDADWNNYYSGNRYVSPVKGWQRVSVSTDSLEIGAGSPSWNTVVQMRLNFWFIGGAPITRIMLDDMSWSATVERDQTLNGKWYDD